MSESSINSLHEKALGGDQAAEEQLFAGLSARFRVFVYQRIWNQHDAEEIVQDALMTIYKEYKKTTFITSFAAWAYKVLDHRVLAGIQKRKREATRSGRLTENRLIPVVNSLKPNPDLKRKLRECLRKITQANIRYARILNLHYQGYNTEEICGKLDLKPSNFYSILSRARSMLDNCLDQGDIG